MSRLIVFDDRNQWNRPDGPTLVDLTPVTDLRATFDIRTGMLTTLERLARESPEGLAAVWVPEEIRGIVLDQQRTILVNQLPRDDSFLCINGRWSYPAARFELRRGQALLEGDSGDVVAAELYHDQASHFLHTGRLPGSVECLAVDQRMMIRKPWEIIGLLHTTLLSDLMAVGRPTDSELPTGVTVIGDEFPLTIDPSARVLPTAVIDVTHGPVLIDARATVRPGAIVIGPAYIGFGSTVLDRTLIKANTVIGPVCKVAGEVGGTIFQGFSNKAHDGHLGDSYVGEWVNIGAGTTNSNLLNTYGEVTMRLRPNGRTERTGMQFLGTIFGDHAKLAIGMRLMTGTVIGTGAMLATSAPPPTCVPPFGWITDSGERIYRLNKFMEVARLMMTRRDVELSESMVEALTRLHPESVGVRKNASRGG